MHADDTQEGIFYQRDEETGGWGGFAEADRQVLGRSLESSATSPYERSSAPL